MFNENEILNKASYCLGCKAKPCSLGCPLSNDTAGFISLVKEKKYYEAYRLLSKTTVLPALCGKVCPHSKQCEGKCVKGIKSSPVCIGEIEEFIGKLAIENDWKLCENNIKKIGKKVAVVGSGPSGLTCAAFLAMAGVDVTIFEKHSHLGGLFVHGIPNFRLDRKIINQTIDKILELKIEVKTNMELGKDFSLNDLEQNFDAIFLGFGANVSGKMNIDGENLNGVFGGNEFLENKLNIDFSNKVVAVSGGGNVAMDVSRTIKRLGAKQVIVIYRRSENEMPAEKNEIFDAKAEGVEFLFKHNILKILGKEKVDGLELIKTELVKKEGETRLSPVNVPGTNFTLPVDMIFMAVGSNTESSLVSSLGLNLNKWNQIAIDETCQTSNPKVFAGGDASTYLKTGTVAWAARSGRDASESILNFLKQN